jgi:hypothetical protein
MRASRCTICNHRECAAIELAIARRVTERAISKRYGVSPDAVGRHARNHLTPQLRAKLLAGPGCDVDLDRLKESESQSLLAHLVALRHRLFAALDDAEEGDNPMAITRITSQLHTNLEITGKLLGELGVGHSLTQNILIMPAYVEMRVALINALSGFPEAKRAVAAALHQLESKAAAQITDNIERPLFDPTPVTTPVPASSEEGAP